MMIDYKNNIIPEDIKDLKKIFDTLEEYSFLKENWDGYGGNKANLKIIENAKSFISKLMKEINQIPNTMISSYGNVGFYFKLDKNKYIEIEIEENSYSYFVYTNISGLFGKDDLNLNIIDFDLINAIKLMYKEKE